MGPRTINTYRAAIVAFCNWAVGHGRLTVNPLRGLSKLDESDVRRERRALTVDELRILCNAARERPLREALTVRIGENKGKTIANVSGSDRERLERGGAERALVYQMLAFTGLRRGELAKLTVSCLRLDDEKPYLQLVSKNTKGGKAAQIPLHSDLVPMLREHIADIEAQDKANGVLRSAETTPLLRVPRNLVTLLDKDLAYAGILKTDEDRRTVDVHSLRHTFATMLSRAGVTPRMAQELMRHSDIRLTMNTYTHLELADTAKAMDALPTGGMKDSTAGSVLRTGTDDTDVCTDVFPVRSSQSVSAGVTPCQDEGSGVGAGSDHKAPDNSGYCHSMSSDDTQSQPEEEWSGWRESNPRGQLGRLELYH